MIVALHVVPVTEVAHHVQLVTEVAHHVQLVTEVAHHVLLVTEVAPHVVLATHVMLATHVAKLKNQHGKTGSTLSKMMDSTHGAALILALLQLGSAYN
jgi:hypothetical protein